jgi:hypothetical protein
VRRFERLGDLSADAQRFADGHSRAATHRQGLPFDQLEDERANASVLLQTVDRCDVGMVQRCEQARFALETGEAGGISGEGFRQDLDRNVASQPAVAAAINLAHTSGAETADDLVRTNP